MSSSTDNRIGTTRSRSNSSQTTRPLEPSRTRTRNLNPPVVSFLPGPTQFIRALLSRLSALETKVKSLESELRVLRSSDNYTSINSKLNKLIGEKLKNQSFTMTLAPAQGPGDIRISKIGRGAKFIPGNSNSNLEEEPSPPSSPPDFNFEDNWTNNDNSPPPGPAPGGGTSPPSSSPTNCPGGSKKPKSLIRTSGELESKSSPSNIFCSRLGKSMLEHNTFLYHCDNRRKLKSSGIESTYWKCQNRKCKARVVKTGDRIKQVSEHTGCTVDDGERLLQRQLQKTLRDKVVENLDMDDNGILEEFQKTAVGCSRYFATNNRRSGELIKRTIRRIKKQQQQQQQQRLGKEAKEGKNKGNANDGNDVSHGPGPPQLTEDFQNDPITIQSQQQHLNYNQNIGWARAPAAPAQFQLQVQVPAVAVASSSLIYQNF